MSRNDPPFDNQAIWSSLADLWSALVSILGPQSEIVRPQFETLRARLEASLPAGEAVAHQNENAYRQTPENSIDAENLEALTRPEMRSEVQVEVQRRLAEQREHERHEIARDLHDGPIQSLVSILFDLQMAQEALKEGPADPAQTASVLAKTSTDLKNTIQELREMVNQLRPPSVIRFGLSRAVQIHVEDIRARYPDLKLDLDLIEDENLLPEATCVSLYRVFQEAMNNILRHAQAGMVWIRYYPHHQQMVLEIRDNGLGFEVPVDLVELVQSNHFGVAGMIERVEALGGEFAIFSHPGQGTIVTVRVPIK